LTSVSSSIYNTNMRELKKEEMFDWDAANSEKSWIKHGVTNEESEEAFFDPNKRNWIDTPHSKSEKRYIILGKTKKDRLLFIVFTLRYGRIRVISARDANRREKQMYEEAKKA